MLVDQFTGFAIAQTASDGTLPFLHEGRPSADEARQMLRDLSALEYFNGYADAIDGAERLMCLDSMLLIRRGNLDDDTLDQMEFGPQINYFSWFRNDWNHTLRKCNEIYDRTVAAARLPTYVEREAAFSRLYTDVDRMAERGRGNTIFAATLSSSARSDLSNALMVSLYDQGVESARNAQDRTNAQLELDRIAAALAVYRAEHDAYPEKLHDLVPSVLEKLPVDLFHGRPHIYRRIHDGYLLYTLGPNDQDDGGSHDWRQVLEGHWVGDLDQPWDIPRGADDIAIRVPRPPLKQLRPALQ
jgi:hypothetical protein